MTNPFMHHLNLCPDAIKLLNLNSLCGPQFIMLNGEDDIKFNYILQYYVHKRVK